MKFTLSWLKDHIDTSASVEEIARTLNAIGLEVEGVEDPASRLAGFRVAKVLTAERHPNADKLQVLTVDAGDGKPLQVVCGAPNARAGLVGVLGLPGAIVPANGMELKVAAVRGVESNGMMCSTRELELGEDHEGIIELPADAPVGTAFADYAGTDPVFDVAITPNRPDCMGVNGIARDLIAAKLGMPPMQAAGYQVVEGAFPFPAKIRVEPDSGCHIFWGRVIRGVTNGPSPDWLQARLKAVGLRPISALVDITNFFSLDQARPLHVYDMARLSGAVVARRGREGESFLALNDKEYTVTPDDCVIADDARVLGLGGVMGGEHSGVTEGTTDVLLECAWFDPEWIGRTGRRHGISSDARARFERGIDPMMLSTAIETAAQMIVELCGGEVSEPRIAGKFPVGGYPETTHEVAYRPSLAKSLGGVDIAPDVQRGILGRLGFLATDPDNPECWMSEKQRTATLARLGWDEAASADPDRWLIRVPTWRPDIDGAPDIVEEVIRIHGLENVASVALPRAAGVARPTATPAQKLERRLRRAAAARGNDEAVTWSFLPEADADLFCEGNGGLWTLANPISEDMKSMRPSLLPGLLAAARRNLDRGAAGLRLFEIGRRYLRGEHGMSDERLSIAVVLAGEKAPRGWASGKAAEFDAYDAKAEALALLAEAGAPVDNLLVMGDAGAQFHPGQSATLRLGPKNVLARFGMLHPVLLKRFDIDAPVAVAELFLDAIPGKKGAATFARAQYAPPALQAVTRDFAFLVAADLPAGDLVRVVKLADKANIVAARLFDDFRGQGVPDGQKSLAVEVTLQPGDKSYDEAELKAIAEKITAAATKLGAVLRG
jgi:phenylalanyl-tRNA synthetase beta chain